jgi:protein-tyrosine-phosphatase
VQCPREIKVEGDWGLPDPIGLDIDKYRDIRDQIEQKVRALL